MVDEPEHRLADHEREVAVEAVTESLLQVRDRIEIGAGRDEHVVHRDAHVEPPRVVGPQVERAAGLEVELRVVPVTGEQPGLDRPLVQREAHVRAAIFDRPRAVVVPEHDHRDRAHLGEQLALTAEIEQRTGTHLFGLRHTVKRTTADAGPERAEWAGPPQPGASSVCPAIRPGLGACALVTLSRSLATGVSP